MSSSSVAPNRSEECPVCGCVALTPTVVRGVPALLSCSSCSLTFRRDTIGGILDRKLDPGELLRLGKSRNALYQSGLRRFEERRQIGTILDIGSGGGQFAQFARDRDWKVSALENSSYLCRASVNLGTSSVVLGTAFTLPFGPRRFDVVTMWDVLDHLEQPLPALREALRVLRPGGMLYARVRNGPIHMALRRSALIPTSASVFHTLLFSRASLTAALRLAGFEDVRVGCAQLTTGNPYADGSSFRELMLRALKTTWQGASALASDLTGKRVLLAPSIRAMAIRPGA